MQSAPTYAEYLRVHPCVAPLLQARQREIRLAPDDQLYFCTLPQAVHMVAVAHAGSPSTIAVLPVLARLAQASARISFWVLDPEAGVDLVQQMADDSAVDSALSRRALPLLALFDDERQFLGEWGPHPAGFSVYMDAWRRRHPDCAPDCEFAADGVSRQDATLCKELTHAMRLWYNSGLNQAVIAEVRALLESTLDEWIPDDGEGEEDE